MSDCPDANSFAAFMSGLASETQRERIEEHLDRCAACSEVLTHAVRSDDADPPGHPARVGRYQIVGTLGRGAMGVVYEALDPTLERTLAVKLIPPDLNPVAGARLVAEAKSLGRIAHPHVVRVLDAGEHEGHYYVAMERIDGEPLGAWLGGSARRLADVIAVFAQLGDGLAAVHAAGLTHRDFKPDNVLVARDGHATIIDFGLALDARSATTPREVAGTVAYMAPEQRRGGEVGPAADQHAFCVAFYEAVFGARPGERADPTRGVVDPAPKWLRLALERGLARDPEERWPSLVELVRHLRERLAATESTPRRLNALFQLLLWPFHVAINLLMLKVLTSPPVESNPPPVDATVDLLAGAMATWLIGAFLTGWAPLGMVWTLVNAYGLFRHRRWAYRSTVIYYVFAVPSVVGTPFAVYAFVTLWRKAFPKQHRDSGISRL